jgi:hypothetical protein
MTTLRVVGCVQLPKLLELVGLGYTGWFVYRYLLFKVTRLLPCNGTFDLGCPIIYSHGSFCFSY